MTLSFRKYALIWSCFLGFMPHYARIPSLIVSLMMMACSCMVDKLGRMVICLTGIFGITSRRGFSSFIHCLSGCFPFNVAAAKWHEIFWISPFAVLLYAFCIRRFLLSTSIFCVAAYVFFTSTPYTIRSGGLTEEDALFLVVLCFWLILRRKGTLLNNSFFAGLALGAAFEFRQTFLLDIPFVIGALLHNAHYRGERFRDVLKPFFAIFAGFIIPECLISLYFQMHGEWFTYFESSYLNNFYYIGPARPSRSFADVFSKFWDFFISTGPYLLSPLLALCTRQWVQKDIRWMVLPLLLAFAGDMISVSLSGEYYEHYYVQASVSTALLLAMFAEGLLQRGKQIRQERIMNTFAFYRYGTTSLLLALITILPWCSGMKKYYADYSRINEQRLMAEGPYNTQRSVANAVKLMTSPDERILLIGRDPNSVYILAERYSAARYYHFAPLWKEKLYGSLKEHHKKAYIGDVCRNQPVLLIIDLTSQFPGEHGVERVAKYLPDFVPYIDEHYVSLKEAIPDYTRYNWFWYDVRLDILIRKDKVEDSEKETGESRNMKCVCFIHYP